MWNYSGNPVKIVKVQNWAEYVSSLIDKNLFKSPLIVTTQDMVQRHNLDKKIDDAIFFAEVLPNPDKTKLEKVTEHLLEKPFDCIIAIGGGSAIDTAKYIKLRCSNPSIDVSAISNIEGDFEKEIYFIAIPTTHGSGSEVTKWATIWDMEKQIKTSITHEQLYPNEAVLDASLTLTLPLETSLISILDCISHSLEAMWNKNHNPVSDKYAAEAITTAVNNYEALKENPNDMNTREQLQYAATLSGLAFCSTRTAVAHSMSYPLSIFYDMPHGLAASITIPAILKKDKACLEERLSKLLTELKIDSVERLSDIIKNIAYPELKFELSLWGIGEENIQHLASQSFTKGRADNFIIDVDTEYFTEILKLSL